VLDHVAMDRSSKTKFANRNKIRTADGWMWLTVPTETKGARDTPINQLQVMGEDWKRQHRATIAQFYRGARHYPTYSAGLDRFYQRAMPTLADAAAASAALLSDTLSIDTRSVLSSTLKPKQSKGDLILELCKIAGADTYLSGPFGRDYLDPALFAREGVEILFHDYDHPTYAQVFPGFEPYMSALDLVLNHGPQSLAILSGRAAVTSGATVS